MLDFIAYIIGALGIAGAARVFKSVKKTKQAKKELNLANQIVNGPTFGNMMTKTMLAQEWSMSIEQVIESEAQAQAICMQTGDFKRAYKAFIAKEKPKFEGN